ncbi:protein kinase, putative, partial [Bodo saltans]
MELTSSSNLHVLSVSSPTTECATVVGPISAGHARHVGSGRRTRVPLTVPTESSPLVITAPPTTPILSPSSGMVGSKSCSHLSYSSSGSSCWVGSQPSALSSSVNDLTIVPTQHGGDLTSGDSATNSSSPGQGIRKSLPRPASAPLIKDVGEPLGSGAQAVVCRATLSSFKERVALVMGKQPIPDATMQVLYLLAARRPKHVVAVLHPDVTAAVAPNKCSDRSVDCDKSSAHVFPSECNFDGSGHHGEERECSVAIQECTCSLTDILTKKRYACTKKGFADAVRHLVSHAEAEDERPGLHDCDEGVGKVTQAQTAPSFMFSEATDMPSAPSTVEGVFPAGEQMTPLTNAMSSECCSNIAADDCLADILSPSNNSCAPPHGLDLQNDRLVSEAFLAGLARHILIGLGGLHDLHLAHNDLKMSNILFDEATGTFLLGDLLNASLVDMTQPPTPTTPLTLSDATVVSGIVSSQTSQRQLPPSLFAQSPFRADIRAFALLLLQVSQSIEHDDATITYDGENKQEEGNQAVKDNSAHARRRRRRRCTADNAGDALRLADDGSLTGCNDWIPWEDVERHWRTTDTTAAGNSSLAPPSSKMMAFIKQAFCG